MFGKRENVEGMKIWVENWSKFEMFVREKWRENLNFVILSVHIPSPPSPGGNVPKHSVIISPKNAMSCGWHFHC